MERSALWQGFLLGSQQWQPFNSWVPQRTVYDASNYMAVGRSPTLTVLGFLMANTAFASLQVALYTPPKPPSPSFSRGPSILLRGARACSATRILSAHSVRTFATKSLWHCPFCSCQKRPTKFGASSGVPSSSCGVVTFLGVPTANLRSGRPTSWYGTPAATACQ